VDVRLASQLAEIYEAAIVEVFAHEDDDGVCRMCGESYPCTSWQAVDLSGILNPKGNA